MVSLRHQFESYIPDTTVPGVVKASDWNAEHTLELTGPDALLGVTGGAGAATELPVSSYFLSLFTLVSAAALQAGLSLGALALLATVGTAQIDNDAVTYAKIQNVTDARLLGRAAGSTGDVQELQAGAGLSIGSGYISFAANGVSDAVLRQSLGLSVIGRAGNTTGDVADITAGSDNQVLRRSGTTLGFGTVATGGIANNAVNDTKIRYSGACSVIGRSANSSGDPADISAASNDTFLQRVGDALGWGTLTVGMIPNSLITYEKLQNVSATARVLGRKSALAGVVEELTLTELLDLVGSAAQGDILYRDASGWTRLGAGTNGHFLKTQGAAANPVWAAASGGGSGALVAIERKTGAGVASYDFVTGLTGYRTYKLIGWLRPATDGVFLYIRTDSSTGASFDSGASDYKWAASSNRGGTASNGGSNSAAQIQVNNDPGAAQRIGNDSDQRITFELNIEPNSGAYQDIYGRFNYEGADDSNVITGYFGSQRISTTIMDAIQLLFSSGNIAAGDVTLYGVANS